MKVRLIAKTQPLIEGMTLEEYVIYIARVSNENEDLRTRKQGVESLLRYMIEHKHWSPFEHAYFTFDIETSMNIGRQLLRHRSATFQEHSQRYSDKVEFEDIEIRKQGDDSRNRQGGEEVFDPMVDEDCEFSASYYITRTVDNSEYTYKALIEAGVAKEVARGVLPGCTRTTLNMTNNIRGWLHFLELRMDSHAQKEAREIAQLIYEELKKEIPFVIKVWEERFTYYEVTHVRFDKDKEYPFRKGTYKTLKDALKVKDILLYNETPSKDYILIDSIGIGGPDTVMFRDMYNVQ